MTKPLYRIVFMGTPDFAVPSLEALARAGMKPVLCVSQPDRPQGRKRKILPTPVKAAAEKLGIELIQPLKVRNQAFLDAVRAAEPDFIVTAAYGRILTDQVLAVPKIAPVNVHGSLLPKYRGASPVQAALINQDKVTGVSIPLMTDKMDAGPVFASAEYVIPEQMRADELMKELSYLGAEILPDTLRGIADGKLRGIPQDEKAASYVSLLDKKSGAVFWDKMTAPQIEGLIRGLYPWPAAYAYFNGKRMKLLQGKAFAENAEALPEHLDMQAAAGTLLSCAHKRLWIKAASGVLRLDELQPEGSRAMSAADCAHNYTPGQKFSSADGADEKQA